MAIELQIKFRRSFVMAELADEATSQLAVLTGHRVAVELAENGRNYAGHSPDRLTQIQLEWRIAGGDDAWAWIDCHRIDWSGTAIPESDAEGIWILISSGRSEASVVLMMALAAATSNLTDSAIIDESSLLGAHVYHADVLARFAVREATIARSLAAVCRKLGRHSGG